MPDDDDADMDPRERGFNYNTGWGSDPKPPTYHYALAILAEKRKKHQEEGLKIWNGDMVCRNVRLAYTGVEKAKSLADLDEWIAQQ